MRKSDTESRRLFLQKAGACLTFLGSGGPAIAAMSTPASASPAWATGGTANIQRTYMDPFAKGLGDLCEVPFRRTTEGPCYSPSPRREDISAGRDGLPTRLALKVVDSACRPLPDAEVDIWHCDNNGVYSGDGMRAARFCSGGNQQALQRKDFRGVTTCDEDGTAWFSTCFPGWYPGRAVHIHFIVNVYGRRTLTSQLAFDDGLVDEILASQPTYAARGEPDTHNRDDGIFPTRGIEAFRMHTERMPDGVLLGWKTLMLDL